MLQHQQIPQHYITMLKKFPKQHHRPSLDASIKRFSLIAAWEWVSEWVMSTAGPASNVTLQFIFQQQQNHWTRCALLTSRLKARSSPLHISARLKVIPSTNNKTLRFRLHRHFHQSRHTHSEASKHIHFNTHSTHLQKFPHGPFDSTLLSTIN